MNTETVDLALDRIDALKLTNGLKFLLLHSRSQMEFTHQKEYYNSLIDTCNDVCYMIGTEISGCAKFLPEYSLVDTATPKQNGSCKSEISPEEVKKMNNALRSAGSTMRWQTAEGVTLY